MKSIQWPTAAVCIVFVLVVGALLFYGKTVPAGWVGMAGTIVASFMQAILGGGSSSGGGTVVAMPRTTTANGPVPPAAARTVANRSMLYWPALGVFVLALCGCPNGQIPPQTVTGITAGVDFAVCVLGQDAQCQAAKTPVAACVVQIIQACGGDAASVASVLDAHRAAEVREGFVLAPDAGR